MTNETAQKYAATMTGELEDVRRRLANLRDEQAGIQVQVDLLELQERQLVALLRHHEEAS